MAKILDAALAQDERVIVVKSMTKEETLVTATGECGEATVLDLITAYTVAVEMRENRASDGIDPYPASKSFGAEE
jgi:hypothetical protein